MNRPVSPKLDKLLLDMGIDMPVSPTISDVIMWLYEKHDYWCYTYTNGKIWHPCIQHKFGDMAVLSGKIGQFNSLTEAYEAAIEYTLNNLT